MFYPLYNRSENENTQNSFLTYSQYIHIHVEMRLPFDFARNNENRQQINKQINQKFWAILTKSNKITSIFPSE